MKPTLLQMRGLSLERLSAFCEVYHSRGLSTAARDKARVAQLSRQMKDLEAYFGVQLFSRTREGMIPSPLADELYQIVVQDLRRLEEFRARCGGHPVVLRVTAGSSFIHWRAGPLLGGLRARMPHVQWEFQARRFNERVPAVRNHECDFAVVRRELVTRELKGIPLMTVGHRMVVRRDLLQNTRAGDDAARLLQTLPLALPPEGDFREALDRQAWKQGLRLSVALHVTSFIMAADAARTGSFAAILPRYAADTFDQTAFAVLPVPLMNGFVQHLELCSSPRFTQVSRAAEDATRVLHSLWHGDGR